MIQKEEPVIHSGLGLSLLYAVSKYSCSVCERHVGERQEGQKKNTRLIRFDNFTEF